MKTILTEEEMYAALGQCSTKYSAGKAVEAAIVKKLGEQRQEPEWIDPNDKTQAQFLPWIGEAVLFCHDGTTYYGHHNGGRFVSGRGVTAKLFDTWECWWMYPPEAKQTEEAL